MRSLSGQEMLRIWEMGREQHPIDRALTMLVVASQTESRSRLAELPLGRRDALLCAVRARTFGPDLAGRANCLACQQPMEFVLNLADLLATASDLLEQPLPAQKLRVTTADFEIMFRPPNSFDLAALVGQPGLENARTSLLLRCVERAVHAGEEVAAAVLPELAVQVLTEEMAASDPLADIRLDLTCAACGHAWQVVFDIVAFLWAEIAARAQRLLREVHLLAKAYGWREAEILAMSAARRQLYLEMVS